MPIYDYRCRECGHVEEQVKHVDDVTDECEKCAATSDRIFSAQYYINPDVDFVTDNITGENVRVTSRKQLDRLMKDHGLYQRYGKGWH